MKSLTGRGTPFVKISTYSSTPSNGYNVQDAEGWYAGCHLWSKLDSDDMNYKVITILEQKHSNFIKSSFN